MNEFGRGRVDLKKVLVISDNDFLLVGIERLLKTIVDFSIQKEISQDEEEITRHIEEIDPEIVIIDGSLNKNGSKLITRLLYSRKALRLLIMHIDSNHVQIYDKREVSLEQTTDLTAII